MTTASIDLIKPSRSDKNTAKRARQEVIDAMGTDRGYDGYFIPSMTPCPACEREGAKTNGGYTPHLRVRVADGVVTQAIVCHQHGENFR